MGAQPHVNDLLELGKDEISESHDLVEQQTRRL
jgi:hypothetical protein